MNEFVDRESAREHLKTLRKSTKDVRPFEISLIVKAQLLDGNILNSTNVPYIKNKLRLGNSIVA